MKNKRISSALIAILIISGCSKKPDNASEWLGVYKGNLSATYNINQVTITEVDPATLNIQFQIVAGGTTSTVSIPSVKLQTSYTIAFGLSDSLPGSSGAIQFTGSGTLNGIGDTLTLVATGTDRVTDSVRVLSFYGGK